MVDDNKRLVIGWKVASLAFNVASVRYRAMLPLLALESENIFSHVFSDARFSNLNELDVLVIVKSFTPNDYLLAQQAVSSGVPVVLDLCDNIFIDTYGSFVKSKALPSQMFLTMARLADAVVVTTESLAQIVRDQLAGKVPVYVIPDGIETATLRVQMQQRLQQAEKRQQGNLLRKNFRKAAHILRRILMVLSRGWRPLMRRIAHRTKKELHWKTWAKRAYRAFCKLRTLLKQKPRETAWLAPPLGQFGTAVSKRREDVPTILWFGNHGAVHANFGMLDLLQIRHALETVATEFDVELVVVSNNPEKYRTHIAPFSISSRYVEWSADALQEELARASVVVLPNSRDAFSLCKSANRAVLALSAGVPVVATSTPAIECMAECVIFDDFLEGLRLYLGQKSRAKLDVAHGKKVIQSRFGQTVIASAWKTVFRALKKPQPMQRRPEAEFYIVLHLAQDLDLALPIIDEALQRNLSLRVCCTAALLQNSPRVINALQRRAIDILPLPDDAELIPAFAFPRTAKALLTITETNLAPHKITRRMTEIANAAGLVTATLQHGFENVGLTYDDPVYQSIKQVNFAARNIYLWGKLDTLHPDVPMATRQKCIPIGCSKPASMPAPLPVGLLPERRAIIGVFENLHWQRYSDNYREFFIDGIQKLAYAFPDLTFLIKPHHAGRWLTSRYTGDVPAAENIIIADPKNAAWEAFTAPSLMRHVNAVITSPSTVALDAARQNIPVAVVAHTLALDNYRPLPRISTDSAWSDFINAACDSSTRQRLVEQSQEFVGRVLLPDGAEKRIVNDLMSKVETRSEAIA